MACDASVVLTTYNQPLADVLLSCASVLLQNDLSYELIITDDSSDNSHFAEIKDFVERNFPDSKVKYLNHSTNQKTVLNLYDGVSCADGFYTKELGAGDMLYDYQTLAHLVNYANLNQSEALFGKIACYLYKGRNISTTSFNAPKDNSFYSGKIPHIDQAMKMILTADWIPGSAQFYRTDLYGNLLKSLSDDYGVLYCEDFVAVLSLINRPFSFLDETILWYKVGDGISTNGSDASRKRMYSDHSRFYTGLQNSPLSMNHGYYLALLWFKIRKLFALHSPFAGELQKLAAKSYQTTNEPDIPLTTLFWDCFERVQDYLYSCGQL